MTVQGGLGGGARWWHGWAGAALVLAACAAVYWPLLGSRPFDFSEGHRVVPGWTMLETGEWWRERMFGLTYLRKPPGMPWAIGGAAVLFGETEWAARSVSAACATLAALLAWAFARRWLGRGPGAWVGALAAGLAQALMPLMWSPGRTAEIEMLNTLGTQAMAFGVVDIYWRRWVAGTAAMRPPAGRWRGVGVLACAAGIVAAALAKGPASLPVLVGAVLGACVLARSARPAVRWRVWAAVVLGACVLVPIGIRFIGANHDPIVVREDVAERFLWSAERVIGVLTLAPMAALSALPASIAAAFVFGRRARVDAAGDAGAQDAYIAARLCVFGWLGSLAVFVAAGVSNARYAMPAAVLLPPVVGYVVLGCVRARRGMPGAFDAGRARLARVLVVGRVEVWAPVLALAAIVATVVLAGPRRGDADAGVLAARVFAEALPVDATVWADDAIEARPDVLLYARRFKGGALRPVWAKPWMAYGELPSPGSFVLLRMDGGSGEGARYADAIVRGRLSRIATASVRTCEFVLFRVVE